VASAFRIAPPLNISHDQELELPCSDDMWQAADEAAWNEARVAEAEHDGGGGVGTMTVRDAVTRILTSKDYWGDESSAQGAAAPDPVALRWSPYAVVCIMHIMSTRIWHWRHGPLTGVMNNNATPPAPGPVRSQSPPGGPKSTSGAVPRVFFEAGRRCRELIRAHSEQLVEQQRESGKQSSHRTATTATRGTAAAAPGGSQQQQQLGNAADVLRVCHARLAPALTPMGCDTLLLLQGGAGEDEDMRAVIWDHVRAPLERDGDYTRATAVAFEGLAERLRLGAQLHRKTGALGGSLERLVSGWDSGEFSLS
jgi:hypothetical protein